MGFRDVFNANSQATKAVLALVVIIAVGVVTVQVFGGRRQIVTKLPDVYFTDDDGKTFFSAGSENIPPWDHRGKTAVYAYVYRCDGADFVGFMSRFTPDALKRIAAAKRIGVEDMTHGRELKRPGDKDWVKADDVRRASQIADVKGAKGQDTVEPIEPGS